MTIFSTLMFALIIWLGMYLLVREAASMRLRWAGVGLLVFAGVLASQIVTNGPYTWLLLVIGVGLLLLDLVAMRQGVLDLGEAFWPDFFRSLDASALVALLFSLPVAITIRLATGSTRPMLILLLVILTLAMASQVFAEWLQGFFDQVAFATFPQLQQQRSALRATVEALPKIDETVETTMFDEVEFVHLTRRALSHYGDLPRLATSPLTRLPIINARLSARSATDHTLERAAELKALLLEAILYLKPKDQADFATTEAWRHYNALYFPYVVSLKPYSRRTEPMNLDATSQQALDWLRAQVPERTLHNWQNAAAKLVAQYLKETN